MTRPPEFAGEPAVAIAPGVNMPLLGLGVWQLAPGRETRRAVGDALRAGYRHVDTAPGYRNEQSVGDAIREVGIPRHEIFVTTKMRPSDDPDAALAESLERLGMDHVDLFLIHWPGFGAERHWPSLEEIRARGLARAVGVSNWGDAALADLVDRAEIPPAVNQIEFNPFVYSERRLARHRDLGVTLEAYSPFARGPGVRDPVVMDIAARRGRTAAQVLVRWAIERGIPTIPRSRRRERIQENRDVFAFSLEPHDMRLLDGRARR